MHVPGTNLFYLSMACPGLDKAKTLSLYACSILVCGTSTNIPTFYYLSIYFLLE